MDRELSKSYLKKRKLRRWLTGTIIAISFAGLALIVPSFMEPAFDPDEYRLGEVTRGDIVTSLSTEGKVEPLYQEVITSPVSTRVEAINYQPGDTIDTTQSILRLDMSSLRRKYQRVKNELALKENSTARKREELRKRQRQLQAGLRADSLRTARLKAYYQNEKKLLEIGGTSRETVEKARIEYQLNKLEQQKLQDDYESFKRMIRLDISSLNLEMSMKRQEMKEMEETLDRARILASRNGMVTRIGVTPGETVGSGQEVARVACLDEYLVRGRIHDRFVDRVYPGQPVEVLIDDTTLYGQVGSLSPGVDHGELDYSVRLNESTYPGLKAKKQVEIRLVQNHIYDTLRIPNAGYYEGEGLSDLFVFHNNEVLKRQVRLGSCSYQHVVVISGLKEGDRLILSKDFYQTYERHQRLKIK